MAEEIPHLFLFYGSGNGWRFTDIFDLDCVSWLVEYLRASLGRHMDRSYLAIRVGEEQDQVPARLGWNNDIPFCTATGQGKP